MTNAKVVFIHGLGAELVKAVLDCNPPGLETVAINGKATPDELVTAVRDADFLMIYRARPADEIFRAARKTKLVQVLSAGYDMLKVDLLRELKLPLANNSGANSWAVADHTVLAMLAVYRRVVQGHFAVQQGAWQAPIDGTNTFEMANKLVGIVGLGAIGKKVARRVQAFDARVQYHNPRPLNPEMERELGVSWVPLDELIRTSDIVSLHTPLTDATRGMISRERIAAMKPTSVLVNMARGEVVDQDALVQALQERRILGAGLDAFDPEPLPAGHPLGQLENVVLSPHTGGTTWDTWTRRASFAYDNFQRVQRGEAALALVLAEGASTLESKK